jgi:hypothetical protein
MLLYLKKNKGKAGKPKKARFFYPDVSGAENPEAKPPRFKSRNLNKKPGLLDPGIEKSGIIGPDNRECDWRRRSTTNWRA